MVHPEQQHVMINRLGKVILDFAQQHTASAIARAKELFEKIDVQNVFDKIYNAILRGIQQSDRPWEDIREGAYAEAEPDDTDTEAYKGPDRSFYR